MLAKARDVAIVGALPQALMRALVGSYSGRSEAIAGYAPPGDLDGPRAAVELGRGDRLAAASTIARPTAPPSVKPYDAART